MKQFAASVSRQTKSGIPKTSHQTSESNADTAPTPQQNLLNLQRTIGNAAVRRLVSQTSPTDQLQRHITMTSADLSGKTASTGFFSKFKDNSTLSTFRKIEETLDKYHQTSKTDNAALYKHVDDLLILTNKWLDSGSHLKQSDDTKHASLVKLKQQLEKEHPRALIGKKIGLPHELIQTLNQADVEGLAEVIQHFDAGRGQSGIAKFNQVKPNLGNSGSLIEAFIKRNYIGIFANNMYDIMNDPEFKQSDQHDAAAINTINVAAQAKLDRLDELKRQAQAAIQELNASKGAKKQAEFPILNSEDPLCIEHAKLQLQKPQFESIINGNAEKGKRTPEFAKLSPAELTGLIGYTSELYGQVNTPLRTQVGTNTMDAGKSALIGATVSGLNKLKDYEGEVYRHGKNFSGYEEVHHPGAIVSDMAFLSTAKEQKGCASAAENHDVLEIISSKTGRDVSNASVFGTKEAEVLFRPGTKFQVMGVISRKKNTLGQNNNPQHWEPQNSPYFNQAMALIANEPNFVNTFQHVVFKTEV